jgi:hypothetical protein
MHLAGSDDDSPTDLQGLKSITPDAVGIDFGVALESPPGSSS